eukprot:gene8100-5636_t
MKRVKAGSERKRGSQGYPSETGLPPAPRKLDLGLLFIELKNQKPRRLTEDGKEQDLDVLLFGGGNGSEQLNNFLISKGCPQPSLVAASFAAAKEHSAMGRALAFMVNGIVRIIEGGVELGADVPEEWESYVHQNQSDLLPYVYELQGFSSLLTYLWSQIASAEVRYWWALKQQWADVGPLDSTTTTGSGAACPSGGSAGSGGGAANVPPPHPPAKRQFEGSTGSGGATARKGSPSPPTSIPESDWASRSGGADTAVGGGSHPHTPRHLYSHSSSFAQPPSHFQTPPAVSSGAGRQSTHVGRNLAAVLDNAEKESREASGAPLEPVGPNHKVRAGGGGGGLLSDEASPLLRNHFSTYSLDSNAAQHRGTFSGHIRSAARSGGRLVAAAGSSLTDAPTNCKLSTSPTAVYHQQQQQRLQQTQKHGAGAAAAVAPHQKNVEGGSPPSLESNSLFATDGDLLLSAGGSPPRFQPPPAIVPEWVTDQGGSGGRHLEVLPSGTTPNHQAGHYRPSGPLHRSSSPDADGTAGSTEETHYGNCSENTVLTALSPLYCGNRRRLGSQSHSSVGASSSIAAGSSSQNNNNNKKSGRNVAERSGGGGGVMASWSFHGFTSLNKPLRKSSMWAMASVNNNDGGGGGGGGAKPPAPPLHDGPHSPSPPVFSAEEEQQQQQHPQKQKARGGGSKAGGKGLAGVPAGAAADGNKQQQQRLNSDKAAMVSPSPSPALTTPSKTTRKNFVQYHLNQHFLDLSPSPSADTVPGGATPVRGQAPLSPSANRGGMGFQRPHSLQVTTNVPPSSKGFNFLKSSPPSPLGPLLLITSTSPTCSGNTPGNSPKPSTRRVTAVPTSLVPSAFTSMEERPISGADSRSNAGAGTGAALSPTSQHHGTGPSITIPTANVLCEYRSPHVATPPQPLTTSHYLVGSSRQQQPAVVDHPPRPRLHLQRHKNLIHGGAAAAAAEAEAIATMRVSVATIGTVQPRSGRPQPVAAAAAAGSTAASCAPLAVLSTTSGTGQVIHGPNDDDDASDSSRTRSFHESAQTHTMNPISNAEPGGTRKGGSSNSSAVGAAAHLPHKSKRLSLPERLLPPPPPPPTAVEEVARRAREMELQRQLGVKKIVNYAERDLDGFMSSLDQELEALFGDDSVEAAANYFINLFQRPRGKKKKEERKEKKNSSNNMFCFIFCQLQRDRDGKKLPLVMKWSGTEALTIQYIRTSSCRLWCATPKPAILIPLTTIEDRNNNNNRKRMACVPSAVGSGMTPLGKKFAEYRRRRDESCILRTDAPTLLDRLYLDDRGLRSLRVNVALLTSRPSVANARVVEAAVQEANILSAAINAVEAAAAEEEEAERQQREEEAAAQAAAQADNPVPDLPTPLPTVLSAMLPQPFTKYIPGVAFRCRDKAENEEKRLREAAEAARKRREEETQDAAALKDSAVPLPSRPQCTLPEPLVLSEALLYHKHLRSLEVTPEALHVLGSGQISISPSASSRSGDLSRSVSHLGWKQGQHTAGGGGPQLAGPIRADDAAAAAEARKQYGVIAAAAAATDVGLPRPATAEEQAKRDSQVSALHAPLVMEAPRLFLWSRFMQACYHHPLRSLQLGGLHLTPEELEHTLELVAHLAGVEECGSPIHLKVDPLGRPLRHGTLELLDLSHTIIPPRLARRLGQILFASRSSLVRVDLSECYMGDEGLKAMMESYPGAAACETDGGSPEADEDGASEADNHLNQKPPYRLRWLSLRWNSLTHQVEKQLLQCFPSLALLRALDGGSVLAVRGGWSGIGNGSAGGLPGMSAMAVDGGTPHPSSSSNATASLHGSSHTEEDCDQLLSPDHRPGAKARPPKAPRGGPRAPAGEDEPHHLDGASSNSTSDLVEVQRLSPTYPDEKKKQHHGSSSSGGAPGENRPTDNGGNRPPVLPGAFNSATTLAYQGSDSDEPTNPATTHKNLSSEDPSAAPLQDGSSGGFFSGVCGSNSNTNEDLGTPHHGPAYGATSLTQPLVGCDGGSSAGEAAEGLPKPPGVGETNMPPSAQLGGGLPNAPAAPASGGKKAPPPPPTAAQTLLQNQLDPSSSSSSNMELPGSVNVALYSSQNSPNSNNSQQEGDMSGIASPEATVVEEYQAEAVASPDARPAPAAGSKQSPHLSVDRLTPPGSNSIDDSSAPTGPFSNAFTVGPHSVGSVHHHSLFMNPAGANDSGSGLKSVDSSMTECHASQPRGPQKHMPTTSSSSSSGVHPDEQRRHEETSEDLSTNSDAIQTTRGVQLETVFQERLFIYLEGNYLSSSAFSRWRRTRQLYDAYRRQLAGSSTSTEIAPHRCRARPTVLPPPKPMDYEGMMREAVAASEFKHHSFSMMKRMLQGLDQQVQVSREAHWVAFRKKELRRARRANRAAAKSEPMLPFIRMNPLYALRKIAEMVENPLMGGRPYVIPGSTQLQRMPAYTAEVPEGAVDKEEEEERRKNAINPYTAVVALANTMAGNRGAEEKPTVVALSTVLVITSAFRFWYPFYPLCVISPVRYRIRPTSTSCAFCAVAHILLLLMKIIIIIIIITISACMRECMCFIESFLVMISPLYPSLYPFTVSLCIEVIWFFVKFIFKSLRSVLHHALKAIAEEEQEVKGRSGGVAKGCLAPFALLSSLSPPLPVPDEHPSSPFTGTDGPQCFPSHRSPPFPPRLSLSLSRFWFEAAAVEVWQQPIEAYANTRCVKRLYHDHGASPPPPSPPTSRHPPSLSQAHGGGSSSGPDELLWREEEQVVEGQQQQPQQQQQQKPVTAHQRSVEEAEAMLRSLHAAASSTTEQVVAEEEGHPLQNGSKEEDPSGEGLGNRSSDGHGSPEFEFPSTLQPKPFRTDKFLSIQTRTVDHYVKLRRQLLARHAKLRADREEQLARTPHCASPLPPPLPLSLATEVEVLERRLLQLEAELGFTLTDDLFYHHFALLVDLGAHAAALQWLEEKILLQGRGPPFPAPVRRGLHTIMTSGVLPLFPDPAAGLRIPIAVPAASGPTGGTPSRSVIPRLLHALCRAATSATPLHAGSSRLKFSAPSLRTSPLPASATTAAYADELRDLAQFFHHRSGLPLDRMEEEEGTEYLHGAGQVEASEAEVRRQQTLEKASRLVEEVRTDTTLRPPDPYAYPCLHPRAFRAAVAMRQQGETKHENKRGEEKDDDDDDDDELDEEEEVEVDHLLRVAPMAERFYACGESGCGAVGLTASSGRRSPPSTPLHPSYTHHVVLTYLLPLLHIAEGMGLLFSEVTPMRAGGDPEAEEEEARHSASPPLKEFLPAGPGGLARQMLAVKRVLSLCSADGAAPSCDPGALDLAGGNGNDSSKREKDMVGGEEVGANEPSTALLEMKETLDVYTTLLRCVCDSKEPTLITAVHVSLLSGFFHLEEGSVPSPSREGALPCVAEEAWLQNLPNDAAAAARQERLAGRLLLHTFLQDALRRLYAARQSIHTERLLVWRSVDILHSWGAFHALLVDEQRGSAVPPLHLCRAFQCWHHEWARTTAGEVVAVGGGRHTVDGAPTLGCAFFPLYPRPAPSAPLVQAPTSPQENEAVVVEVEVEVEGVLQRRPFRKSSVLSGHRQWHQLWNRADTVTRAVLRAVLANGWGVEGRPRDDADREEVAAMADSVREGWEQTAWLVQLTPQAGLRSAPPGGESHGQDPPTTSPSGSREEGDPDTVQTVLERNVELHQQLLALLLAPASPPVELPAGADTSSVAPAGPEDSSPRHVPHTCYTARLAKEVGSISWKTSSASSREGEGGAVARDDLALLWEALAERLLLYVSMDLHMILREVPALPEPHMAAAAVGRQGSGGSSGLPEVGGDTEVLEDVTRHDEFSASVLSQQPAEVELEGGGGAGRRTEHGGGRDDPFAAEVPLAGEEDSAPFADAFSESEEEMAACEAHHVGGGDEHFSLASESAGIPIDEEGAAVATPQEQQEGAVPLETSGEAGNDGGSPQHSVIGEAVEGEKEGRLTRTLNYIICLVAGPKNAASREKGGEEDTVTVQDICAAAVSAVDALLQVLEEEPPVPMSVSTAPLASLAQLMEACGWSGRTTTYGRHSMDVLRRVGKYTLMVLQRMNPSTQEQRGECVDGADQFNSGNAVAIIALATARAGLWEETEALLRLLLGDSEISSGASSAAPAGPVTAVQLDPSIAAALFHAARDAGEASKEIVAMNYYDRYPFFFPLLLSAFIFYFSLSLSLASLA